MIVLVLVALVVVVVLAGASVFLADRRGHEAGTTSAPAGADRTPSTDVHPPTSSTTTASDGRADVTEAVVATVDRELDLPSGGAAYADYDALEDASGDYKVDVPADFADREIDDGLVVASTDIASLEAGDITGVTDGSAPGVVLRATTYTGTPDEVLGGVGQAFGAGNGASICDAIPGLINPVSLDPVELPEAHGLVRTSEACDGSGAGAVDVFLSVTGETRLVVLSVRLNAQRDIAALERALETLALPAVGDSGGAAAVPTDLQQFLRGFLETFLAGDQAALADYATPEALASFNQTPEPWSDYLLDFSTDSCSIGSSGSGACGFDLVDADGGSAYFVMSYHEADASGRLVIDSITVAGD